MSDNIRSAPPSPTRTAASPTQARTAPSPAIRPPSPAAAPPPTPVAIPEHLTIVPRLAAGDGAIDVDWEPAVLGTNRSYGCVATTPTREPIAVTVTQALYRRSFEASGAVRVSAIPPAPEGTEGSMTARNTVTGASVTYTWRWQPRSAAGASGPATPKRGLLGRLFGAAPAAPQRSRARTAKKAGTVAERLGSRAHLACRVKFFGQETEGQRFAFVVDKSGSMDGARWQACVSQLEQALWSLSAQAQFAVVLFDTTADPAGATWLPVDAAHLDAAIAVVKNATPGGGTAPAPAFASVFRMPDPPDVIFFLTDGELGEFGVDDVAALKGSAPTVVNTIALENDAGSGGLGEIAADSGGHYVFIRSATDAIAG